MKTVGPRTLLAAALLLSATGVARGEILGFDPALARLVTKPGEMHYRGNAFNRPRTQIWNERQGFVLPVGIPVDIVNEGVYGTTVQLGNASIPAGTRVDSHMVYFDPANKAGADLTVTFSGRILGVVLDSDRMGLDRLVNSDNLALPEVPDKNFPHRHFKARGLEMPIAAHVVVNGRVGGDWVRVQGNAITLHVRASSPGDQIRVITASSR